jgi:hypothetical protein
MKKISLLLIISAFFGIFANDAFSQEREKNREYKTPLDIKDFIEKRNVYLTEKLSLSAEDVKTFLPVDNELMRKKFEVGKDCHQLGRQLRDKKNHTEEEYQKLVKCREEAKAKRFELDKEYMVKFKKILSSEQILIYEKADKDFFDSYMEKRK